MCVSRLPPEALQRACRMGSPLRDLEESRGLAHNRSVSWAHSKPEEQSQKQRRGIWRCQAAARSDDPRSPDSVNPLNDRLVLDVEMWDIELADGLDGLSQRAIRTAAASRSA